MLVTSTGLAAGVIEAFEGVLGRAGDEVGLLGGVPGGVCGSLRSTKIQQLFIIHKGNWLLVIITGHQHQGGL